MATQTISQISSGASTYELADLYARKNLVKLDGVIRNTNDTIGTSIDSENENTVYGAIKKVNSNINKTIEEFKTTDFKAPIYDPALEIGNQYSVLDNGGNIFIINGYMLTDGVWENI